MNAPLSRTQAADARRAGVQQRSHRPKERRDAAHRDDAHTRAHAAFAAELRADSGPTDGTVHFRGLASAYEQGYEMWDSYGPYTEVVAAGAGAVSLARADLDTTLVLGHDQMRRIADTVTGTLTLTETAAGLEVNAPALSLDDVDVAYAVPKLRAGLYREMSFAFRIIRGQWSPDYEEYRILEYDIHRGDVAIVGYGASPHTSAELRSQPTGMQLISEEETRQLMYLPPWPGVPRS